MQYLFKLKNIGAATHSEWNMKIGWCAGWRGWRGWGSGEIRESVVKVNKVKVMKRMWEQEAGEKEKQFSNSMVNWNSSGGAAATSCFTSLVWRITHAQRSRLKLSAPSLAHRKSYPEFARLSNFILLSGFVFSHLPEEKKLSNCDLMTMSMDVLVQPPTNGCLNSENWIWWCFYHVIVVVKREGPMTWHTHHCLHRVRDCFGFDAALFARGIISPVSQLVVVCCRLPRVSSRTRPFMLLLTIVNNTFTNELFLFCVDDASSVCCWRTKRNEKNQAASTANLARNDKWRTQKETRRSSRQREREKDDVVVWTNSQDVVASQLSPQSLVVGIHWYHIGRHPPSSLSLSSSPPPLPHTWALSFR